MRRALWWVSLLFFCFAGAFAPTLARGQERHADSPSPNAILQVSGEVEHPLQLTSAELAKLPRYTARVTDHSGVEATFEGSPLVLHRRDYAGYKRLSLTRASCVVNCH